MEKPIDLISYTFISESEKEVLKQFLLKWGLWYFKEQDGAVQWSSVVKEILGLTKEEYSNLLLKTQDEFNVWSTLKKFKSTIKRPVTTGEIVAELNGNLAERNIYVHLNKLKKHKEIKEHKVIVDKQEIFMYSL